MVHIEVDQTVDWYRFPLNDLTLIAKLVLETLNNSVKAPLAPWPRQLKITNGPTVPQVLCAPGRVASIRVNLVGFFPQQFCYQIAHEWGHVLSNHWQYHNPGPFQWLEESICGSLSICALRGAKISWRKQPSLHQFVDSIEAYIMDSVESKFPLAISDIPNWRRTNELLLRSTQVLNELTGRLSSPLVNKICSSPILVRSLQARNRSSAHEGTIADHLSNWAKQCHTLKISARFPEELANLFDVQIF
jgi:hypothetical protein